MCVLVLQYEGLFWFLSEWMAMRKNKMSLNEIESQKIIILEIDFDFILRI